MSADMGSVILDERSQFSAADASARTSLFPLLYRELRDIADAYFRKAEPGHTLQPTALVHEAFLKLTSAGAVTIKDRAHFLALAAKVMRDLLTNHALGRQTQKRGGDWRRITLDAALDELEANALDVLVLDETLARLSALSERQARIVELRVFGGMTLEEAAEVLDVGLTTVKSDWLIAKAWLKRELEHRSA
jgi:RNA polymerase sigma factor (TIGR02999 family)